MSPGKVWWKSRTVLVNLAGAVVMVAPELMTLPGLEAHRPHIALALTIANVVLRSVTTEPVVVKQPAPPAEP